jgi:hypothetical protein
MMMMMKQMMAEELERDLRARIPDAHVPSLVDCEAIVARILGVMSTRERLLREHLTLRRAEMSL